MLELQRFILKNVKDKLNENILFYETFLCMDIIKSKMSSSLPDGYDIYKLGMLDTSIDVLGINIKVNWQKDEFNNVAYLIANINFYVDSENVYSYHMSELVLSQQIWNDYEKVIVGITNLLLEYNEYDGELLDSNYLKDFHDIIYS